MTTPKWVQIVLSESELKRIMSGERFSKCKSGVQVVFKKGSNEQEKINAQIEELKKQIVRLQNKTQEKSKKRRKQSLKQCPLCVRRVRGLKLHLRLAHHNTVSEVNSNQAVGA